MAILCLRPPQEVREYLSALPVDGSKTEAEDMHVTLLYLGKDLSIPQTLRCVESAYNVASVWSLFGTSAVRVGCFGKNDEGLFPVVAHLESPELHDFRETLKESLKEDGIHVDEKFPDFRPHVTLSYSTETVEDFLITPVRWAVGELTLWGGDEGDTKLSVTFPFDPPKKTPFAAAIKTAMLLRV